MNKLVSLNIGARLIVQDDEGQEHIYQWSAICPSENEPNPIFMVGALCDIINEKFGTDIFVSGKHSHIEIAKPSKLKPVKTISHKAFNRRIKKNITQLGYK